MNTTEYSARHGMLEPRYTASLLVLVPLMLLFFSSTANRVAAFFLFWHGVRIVSDVLHTGTLWPYAWPRRGQRFLAHKWLVFFAACAVLLAAAWLDWANPPLFVLSFAVVSALEPLPSPKNDE